MLYKTVKKIVDGWDPIGLFPHAPKDEYNKESVSICEFIKEMKIKGEIDEQELATKIYKIFVVNFGEDIFKPKSDECLAIALNILEKDDLLISKGN